MSGATAMKGEPLKVIRSKESGVRCNGVYNRRKSKEPIKKKRSKNILLSQEDLNVNM